jgi:hypothetical protein
MTLGIDVAHKGTPKEELTEEDMAEDAVFTTEKPIEYEYEYEYVYEDEYGNPIYDDTEEATPPTTENTSKESLQSILSFLNKESTSPLPDNSLRTKALGGLVPLTLPQHRQPTPLPPIRSSTFLYDQQGNYPEVQRSTVTVEIEDRFGRSRSSLSPRKDAALGPTARSASSPAHPRLDPASSPHSQGGGGENSVNWYYSSYNNENTDPYVGPGGSWSGARGRASGLLLPLCLALAGRML